MASMLSSSHPILANVYACSLLFMLAWALTLWIVVICVRDCSIMVMDSRMFLSGWLSCSVGCLI